MSRGQRLLAPFLFLLADLLFVPPAAAQEPPEPDAEPARVDAELPYFIDQADDDSFRHLPVVLYDPAGRLQAGAGNGAILRLEEGVFRTVAREESAVLAAAFDGQGRLVVLAEDGRISVRSADGALVARSEPVAGALALAVLPPGDRVAVTAGDAFVVLAIDGFAEVARHEIGARAVSLAAAPQGILAVGDDLGRVHLISESGVAIAAIDSSAVFGLAFSPDGSTLAAGGVDQVVRLLDPATGAIRRELPPNEYWVTAIGWSPDGTLVAAGDESCHISVYDLAADEVIATFAHHEECWLTRVAFSPDGAELVFGCRPNQYEGDPALGDADVVALLYAAAEGPEEADEGGEQLAMADRGEDGIYDTYDVQDILSPDSPDPQGGGGGGGGLLFSEGGDAEEGGGFGGGSILSFGEEESTGLGYDEVEGEWTFVRLDPAAGDGDVAALVAERLGVEPVKIVSGRLIVAENRAVGLVDRAAGVVVLVAPDYGLDLSDRTTAEATEIIEEAFAEGNVGADARSDAFPLRRWRISR